jgi:hypothetical protein
MESSVRIMKVHDLLEVTIPQQVRVTLQAGNYQASPFEHGVTNPWEIPRAEVQWWALASNGIFHGILSAEEAEIAERDGHIRWLN